MKTKRLSKKNHKTRNNIPYTPGRNMFGEKAETHYIVLKRETAFQQIMDCISQLDGSNKEFTYDIRCFEGYEEEFGLITEKVEAFLAVKAQMYHKTFSNTTTRISDAA